LEGERGGDDGGADTTLDRPAGDEHGNLHSRQQTNEAMDATACHGEGPGQQRRTLTVSTLVGEDQEVFMG
jgi:hypothetical protein